MQHCDQFSMHSDSWISNEVHFMNEKKRVQKRWNLMYWDANMYWPGNVRVSNQLVAAFQQQSSNHRKRLEYYHPKKKPHLHLHSSGKNLIPTYLCVFLVHTEAVLEHHARSEGHCQSCKQWSCFQTTSGTSCVLEKCTYCITDQLTLSLGPHNDWHCTLRKLQTFTSADKTSVSPHTSFCTSPSLESLKSFMLGSSAAAICERWWRMVMEKLFIP